MKVANNKLTFWIIFLSSLTCYLCSLWVNVFDVYFASCAHSSIFFGITWLWIRKMKDTGMNIWLVAWGVFLGSFRIEFPVYLFDFLNTMTGFMCTICRMAAIVLAVICYKEQNIRVNILALIVMLLLNSVFQYLWLKTNLFINHIVGL